MVSILFLAVLGLLAYSISISGRVRKLEENAMQQTTPATSRSSNISQKKAEMLASNPPVGSGTKDSAPITPRPSEPFDSHSFISLLPKIGVIALVIGLGFFLKYAIDEGWISISLRLIIGGTLGTLLLVLFYYWKEKYEKYSIALAGGGLAIWYLTIWAAVQLYLVLDSNTGLVILSLVSVVGVFLAYKTNSKSMAALSWGGAYLIPIIMTIGTDQYGLLLCYLSIVTTAMLVTVIYNKALHLFLLAIFGSVINILWVSLGSGIPNGEYLYTLTYLLVNLFIFSVMLVASIRNDAQNKESNIHSSDFGLIAASVFGVILIPIAAISYGHYREFAPFIMTAVGIWMFLIYAMVDRLEYKNLNYIISGIGSICLVISAFWYFGESSEIFILYSLGLVGLLVGRIQKRVELRTWGLAVILSGIFAACRVSYVDSFDSLFLSKKFGLEVLGLIALAVSYVMLKKDELTEFENNIHIAIEYMIAVLAWLFVSWDLYQYFNAYDLVNQRNLSLSIWWIVYAIVLIGVSTIKDFKPLRKLGLFLIGLSIIKVFLYDVQSLDTVYRIISFITLGAILLGFSFIYQHNKERIKEYLS